MKIYMKIIIYTAIICVVSTDSKKDIHEKNVRELKKPFRMAKINLIWEKALQKDLSNRKLEVLLSELKMQDKQELTLKKLKAEAGDKDGQMEAQLRKTLSGVMDRYRLGHSADTASEKKQMNALFKDKKLNRLWEKAEMSSFTQEELKALKEEFEHHQEKIDQYYDLLDNSNSVTKNDLDSGEDKYNHLSSMEENENLPELKSVNAIREKHRGLKEGYSLLHKKTSSGPGSKEFLEPKVAGLWRLATDSDFTVEELESLHTELKHYEARLLKVRHLTSEMLRLHKTGEREDHHPDPEVRLAQKLEEVSDSEGERLLKERLVKQRRTVDKLHEHLETRILQRHSEL